MENGRNGMKAVISLFMLLSIATTAFAQPTNSNSSCLDNQTLRVSNYYHFTISQNSTDDINFTQLKDTYCDNGCVVTGNTTAECMQSQLNIGLIVVGIFAVVFIIVIVVLKLSGFR